MADETVLLKAQTEALIKRARANGTITPGDILALDGLNTSGATTERNYSRNSTDGGESEAVVALEHSSAGRGKSDDYSSGDELRYKRMEPGEEYDLFVFDGGNAGGAGTDVAANANISVGDSLVPYSGSGQDGTLRAYDSANDDAGMIVAEATEAVDNSGGSSPARIEVEAV